MKVAGVLPIAEWRMAAPKGASKPLDGGSLNGGPLTRGRVLAITDRCWSCRAKARGIVGVLVDMSFGESFVSFTDVAESLAATVDSRVLAARGIGELRHRDSPGIEGGYVANGCPECDALIGRILLEDLLDEHLRNGGTYAQLDTGLVLELRVADLVERLRETA
jgi:hypothetical protein